MTNILNSIPQLKKQRHSTSQQQTILSQKHLIFFTAANLLEMVDIIIQVVADALGLNIFIYQDNDGCLEVLKICGGELCKDICMKFMYNNKHSIGNHYELMVREVQNKEMKQSVEVKIENEEETSEEEEQKYQPFYTT